MKKLAVLLSLLLSADAASETICNGKTSVITFTTDTEETYAATNGIVSIDGYGNLPDNCKNVRGATCTFELCDMESMTLRTASTDGWSFTITGDIGDLLDYEAGPEGHWDPFPTWLKFGARDTWQTYNLLSTTSDVSTIAKCHL